MAVYSKVNLSSLKSGFRFDAEFYRPEYLFLDEELQQFNCKKINHFANVTDGEHGSVVIRDRGIKYLTAENVKNGYVDITKVRYVDEEVDYRNRRASVRVGDVLISIKGTLGEVAIAEEWLLPANMNRDVAIIKPYDNTSILPEYLTIFLMTKFGIFQGQREGSGGVQQMITLGRLREFLIPELSAEKQIKVKELYSLSLTKKREAEQLYQSAFQLLENHLQLKLFDNLNQKYYTSSFNRVITSRRSDAEFHNPKLLRYYKHFTEISKLQSASITSFAKIKKFGNPNYAEVGIPIITQKHLSEITPENYGSEPIADLNWVSKYSDAILKKNDLLFYSVGAYLGKTNLWLNDDKVVPASFITLLRCENPYDAGYLMVLLNSKYGILQSKTFQSGTSQQYIYPKDIRQFQVPVVENEIKEQLYSLIIQSHKSKLMSKSLLLEAKNTVEHFIEN